MDFDNLNLDENIVKALVDLNYSKVTTIQLESIPIILKGKDLLAISNTGTGKTAAFSLPILDLLLKSNKFDNNNNVVNDKNLGLPKVIILAPTRELVSQIGYLIGEYSKYLKGINYICLHAGFELENQKNDLKSKKFDIVISTPKRLLDLIESKTLLVNDLKCLVLDEVDKIIEEGSNFDLKKIFKLLPKKRQTLMFSATVNFEIEKVIKEILKKDYVKIQINEKSYIDLIEQNVLFVQTENKYKASLDLFSKSKIKNALIFVNDKKEADNLVRFLRNNDILSEALHSAKSNVHRVKVINNFLTGKIRFIIATDLASRGLDIENLTNVINFDLPIKTENYIHRIGRCGRANISGVAFSLCSSSEKIFLDRIENLTKIKLNVINHKYHSNFAQNAKGNDAKPKFNSKKNILKKNKFKKKAVDYSKWLDKK